MAEKIHVICKNFNGEEALSFDLEVPIPFPYLFYKNRLYVASRDEANIMLERSYVVFSDKPVTVSTLGN